ncbi:MAG: histidine kinase dimerization/phospho-acceptor domain-containing protein [Patescibacteria group bacterium]
MVRRRIVRKIMVVSILAALGTVVLIGLVAFRSFQEIVKENVTIRMSELIPAVSATFGDAKTVEEEMRALEAFKYGEHGSVFILPKNKIVSFSEFSGETVRFINSHREGSVQDLKREIKLVSFFTTEDERVAISVVKLADFYTPYLGAVNTFVLGVIFVLFITLGISVFVSIVTTRSIRSLSTSIHRISPHSPTAPQIIHTGDEIQELSEALFEYITAVQQLDKAKNEFILASQHNLRTPLTITRGYIEEMGAHTEISNNPQLKIYIEKTKSSLEILAKLINGLIDVTQLKVGKEGFSKEKKV